LESFYTNVENDLRIYKPSWLPTVVENVHLLNLDRRMNKGALLDKTSWTTWF